MSIAADEVIHRVGGGGVDNLRLSPVDRTLTPPGFSVLLGGTPQEAATAMRRQFPRSKKWQAGTAVVGSATAEAIRAAGFELHPDPTDRFPNHVRIIHPDGAAGFSDPNLAKLSAAFQDTTGC